MTHPSLDGLAPGPDRDLRLRELGLAVGSVAHELRNPLASLTLGLDLLSLHASETPDEQRVLRQARAGVRRISDLVEELLDYVQDQPPALRPCEAGEVVRAAAEACGSLCSQRHVELRAEAGRELWVSADARRLYQAVRNLLENAVQHTPPHGAVAVRFRPEPEGPAPGWVLEVEDTGPGLEGADPARLFEPFFTRRTGGTGLGLAIVQRVARDHRGTVEAEDRPEGGARFRLRLPVSPAPKA